MYTPSSAHSEARSRDAGHDEMQVSVFEYLSSFVGNECLFKVSGKEMPVKMLITSVVAEADIAFKDRIIAFADVAVRVKDASGPDGGYLFFEIKPKIDSVGALLRQCVTLSHCATLGVRYRNSGASVPHAVIPVVNYDDPKLELLRRLSDKGAIIAEWDAVNKTAKNEWFQWTAFQSR